MLQNENKKEIFWIPQYFSPRLTSMFFFIYFFWTENGFETLEIVDFIHWCRQVIVQQIELISAQSTMQELNIRFWAYCTKKERQKKSFFFTVFFLLLGGNYSLTRICNFGLPSFLNYKILSKSGKLNKIVYCAASGGKIAKESSYWGHQCKTIGNST